ncbi:isocitrate lyase/phosphoenolpyruvate mutase family protein [Nocardioidaceae bacterium SCSIO 66511]|nr:isocitrate lyase/phosphoenolpyruvate mutase family protein [Nocardioidaceae bacterium SCSIO 66511]
MSPDQRERASDFARLHTTTEPLILPNAWDVSSARAVERAGATAIATTSAAHAWGLGLDDGGDLDLELVIASLARIVASVDLPVSADIEAGYADGHDELARNIAAILDTGIVGVNLEDTDARALRTRADQAARIETVRRAADEQGVELFINARIDTYFTDGIAETQRPAETLERAKSYVDAGASGVFVPGLLDPPILSELASALQVPVNAMLMPGAPSIEELSEAGVSRISVGPALHGVASKAIEAAAVGLLSGGTYPA